MINFLKELLGMQEPTLFYRITVGAGTLLLGVVGIFSVYYLKQLVEILKQISSKM